MNYRTTMKSWLRRIESIQKLLCVSFLVLMSFIVLIQVISRYLFNYSFVWAEELVRYLMIWMIMIGAALVQMNNNHIRIDFFPLLAGPRVRRIMEIFFRLCTLTFLYIIVSKGIPLSWFNKLFESSGLRISMLWPTIAIPVGALLIGMYTVSGLIKDVHQLLLWSPDKLKELDDRIRSDTYHTDGEASHRNNESK